MGNYEDFKMCMAVKEFCTKTSSVNQSERKKPLAIKCAVCCLMFYHFVFFVMLIVKLKLSNDIVVVQTCLALSFPRSVFI